MSIANSIETYNVLLTCRETTGEWFDVKMTVEANGKTHAGVLARNRLADNRGEDYDPERHKVVKVSKAGPHEKAPEEKAFGLVGTFPRGMKASTRAEIVRFLKQKGLEVQEGSYNPEWGGPVWYVP